MPSENGATSHTVLIQPGLSWTKGRTCGPRAGGRRLWAHPGSPLFGLAPWSLQRGITLVSKCLFERRLTTCSRRARRNIHTRLMTSCPRNSGTISLRRSCVIRGADRGKDQRILPLSTNELVRPAQSGLDHPDLFQHPRRGGVFRPAGCCNVPQPEGFLAEPEEGRCGLSGISATPVVSVNHVSELAPATINGEPDRSKRIATGQSDSESEVCPDRAALRRHAQFEEFPSVVGRIRPPLHVLGDSHVGSKRMHCREIIQSVVAQQETFSLQFHVTIMT